MNKNSRLITALMLGMATLSIPTLATATVTVDIVGASLVARGAGVLVTAEVTCDTTNTLPLDSVIVGFGADITQRVGRFTTGGDGGTNLNQPIICDGSTPVTVEAIVRNFEGVPFKKGLALIGAGTTVCDPNGIVCESGDTGDTGEEIRIR